MAAWGATARPSGRRCDAYDLRSSAADRIAELMSGRLSASDGISRGMLTPVARMGRLRRRISRLDERVLELEEAGRPVPVLLRREREAAVEAFISIGTDGYGEK
jgi:hypothetical protein